MIYGGGLPTNNKAGSNDFVEKWKQLESTFLWDVGWYTVTCLIGVYLETISGTCDGVMHKSLSGKSLLAWKLVVVTPVEPIIELTENIAANRVCYRFRSFELIG